MALSSLYVELKASIADFQSKMGVASAEVKKFEKSNKDAASSTQRAGKMATVALAAVAVGAVGVGVEAVKMAADFQTSQTRLVTSAGESKNNLKMVSDGVLTMAGEVGVGAEKLSAGLYTVESAGYHGADSLKILRAAAEGAKAENADMGTTANAVTDILTDYHLKADDAAGVTSKLVETTAQGKMSFQDLAGAMSTIAPLAAATNIPLQDMLGSIAEMTSHGVSADQATQNLAHSIQKMQAPTAGMRSELGQLGIDASKLGDDLSTKGLTGTMEEVSQAILTKMGPSGKVLLDSFNQSKIAARDANQMYGSMPPQLQKVADEFKSGKITMNEWKQGLKSLPADQGALMTQWVNMQNNANGFTQALKSGGNATQSYTQAMQAATGDSTTMNVALMLTGENAQDTAAKVQAIGAATTEAGGHVKGWSDIQDTANQKMARAKAAVEALGIRIGNLLLPAATAIIGKLADWAGWMSQHSTLAVILGSIIGGVLVLALTAYSVATLKTATITTASMIKDVAKGTWWVASKLAHFALVSARALIHAVAVSAVWLAQGAVMVARGIAQGAVWAAGMVAKFVIVAVGAGVQAAIAVGAWIAQGAVLIAQGIAQAATWVAGMVVKYAIVAGAAVLQAGIAVGAWVVANIAMIAATGGIILAIGLLIAAGVWVVNHWGDIKKFFSALWDDVKRIFSDAIDAVVGFLKQWGTTILAVLLPVVGIPLWIWQHWSQISHIASQVWDAVLGVFSSAGRWLLDGLGNVLNLVVDFFWRIPGQILGALGDLGSLLYNAGWNILVGLWNGLMGMWGKVTNFVGGIASWIADHKGPLSYDATLLTPHGNAIMAGLLGGLKSGGQQVSSYLDEFTKSIGGTEIGMTGNVALGANGAFASGLAGQNQQPPVQITVNVAGSVRTDREIALTVRDQLLQMGGRNPITYQQFAP